MKRINWTWQWIRYQVLVGLIGLVAGYSLGFAAGLMLPAHVAVTVGTIAALAVTLYADYRIFMAVIWKAWLAGATSATYKEAPAPGAGLPLGTQKALKPPEASGEDPEEPADEQSADLAV